MLLHRIEVLEQEEPDRLRVQARVRYEAEGEEELLWFDLPASLESDLSRSGNPWLAALLPLAATLQEPLRIEAAVDEVLLEGCRSLLDVWSVWFPRLRPVRIEAAPLKPTPAPFAAGTGLFFSGGVDSFYSLLRHNGPAALETGPRVTDLILLHGMDIPLSNADAFVRLRPRLRTVATQFGAGLVDIATNLRETRWRQADWGQLSHGAMLAGAGLLLEPRYSRLLVASSAPYGRLQPCGSHPITDPLFSTSRTWVRHDGAATDRPEKLQAIATDPMVLKYLRVCWLGRTDTNCGCCPKCLVAMVGLELAGTLHQSETLPPRLDKAVLGRVYLESAGMYAAYWVVRKYRERAREAGRQDVVALLDDILSRSDRLRFARGAIEKLARVGLVSARLRGRLINRLFRTMVKY